MVATSGQKEFPPLLFFYLDGVRLGFVDIVTSKGVLLVLAGI